jgi:hypothetical protein
LTSSIPVLFCISGSSIQTYSTFLFILIM